eukprot:jgi/Undpi1/8756/HiC_scaffold_25.g11218.m1
MMARSSWASAAGVLLSLAGLEFASAAASLRITNPSRASSYHAGDAVPVQWFYNGTGETFSILLFKASEQVADLCAAEEDGVCFDLTQDQTVLLPETGLESGSDYTVYVKDQSSDAEHTSDPFIIIGSANTNIEVTSPDGFTSLTTGSNIPVEWLYVGENTEFDIYLRKDGDRVSENLCSDQTSGACTSSNAGSATVTLPTEIENGADYRLLVVDRADDDAWGLSSALPIGVEVAAASGPSSESLSASKLALVIGLCVGGVCLLAMLLACCRTRNKNRRRQEKLDTLDMLNKRRPAPSVPLSVEGMAQPDSPDQSDADVQRNFINPIFSTSPSYYDGQITPPSRDSAMWRRSRDLSHYVGRQIGKSFSRSQSNMMND